MNLWPLAPASCILKLDIVRIQTLAPCASTLARENPPRPSHTGMLLCNSYRVDSWALQPNQAIVDPWQRQSVLLDGGKPPISPMVSSSHHRRPLPLLAAPICQSHGLWLLKPLQPNSIRMIEPLPRPQTRRPAALLPKVSFPGSTGPTTLAGCHDLAASG